MKTASRWQVVADVCACVNQAVDRRRAVKDSQEQWYAVGGIRPSSEDSTSRSGVRISNKTEEGRDEHVLVRAPSISVPGPSNLRVYSAKFKKKKISRSPVKRRFAIASPLYHLSNIVWLTIWVLVPLWTVSNPAKNDGAVGETEESFSFFRVACHSCCCFVSSFENCSASSYLMLFAVICSMKLFCLF